MPEASEISVVGWLDHQPSESIGITSIMLFEAQMEITSLPKGKRQQRLETAFV